MSESKHIPGPLVYLDIGEIVREDNFEVTIATLEQHAQHLGPLLAAAPAMYEALKDIEQAGYGGYLTPELCADIVMAALDKAEGRS